MPTPNSQEKMCQTCRNYRHFASAAFAIFIMGGAGVGLYKNHYVNIPVQKDLGAAIQQARTDILQKEGIISPDLLDDSHMRLSYEYIRIYNKTKLAAYFSTGDTKFDEIVQIAFDDYLPLVTDAQQVIMVAVDVARCILKCYDDGMNYEQTYDHVFERKLLSICSALFAILTFSNKLFRNALMADDNKILLLWKYTAFLISLYKYNRKIQRHFEEDFLYRTGRLEGADVKVKDSKTAVQHNLSQSNKYLKALKTVVEWLEMYNVY